MNSDKDGQAFIPEKLKSNLDEDKMIDNIMRKLTEGKTWDEMYGKAMKLINEKELFSVNLAKMIQDTLENVNLETEPYSEMLIKLGGPSLIKNIPDEARDSKDYEEVIKKLIELPEFNPSEELVQHLFKNFDVDFDRQVREAYNSSLSHISDNK